MRLKEYANLTQEVWNMWNEEEERFRDMPEGMKHATSRVDAISIGMADHIMRGKTDPSNKLTPCLRKWLHPLNEKIGKFIKNL